MARAILLLAFCAGLTQGFFLGGNDKDSIGIPVQMGDKLGFRQDQKVFSHLVIPPWSRPFKPGYCTSWEWNTDKRYREQRLAICYDLEKGKHECDSPSGFCKDKCPFTNGSYPYWRIRNAAEVPFLWVVASLQMYDTPFSNKPLTRDPHRGYASSYFGPGYKPSNAFDNNQDTLWISNGGAPPGMQWIAYEFDRPVFVGSIRIALEDGKPDRSPSMMYVEASCEKYFKNFVTYWVINNPRQETDKRYNVFGQAKFTNLGASGRLGPVTVGSHYKGQDHEGQVSVNKGVQMWKVPATGTYSIEAAGASGGYDKFSGASKFRGRGARVKGNFKLKKGDVLKILVGHEGQHNTISGGAGGGGGSFVVKQDNSPLIIAGGGGGVDKMKSESPRCHGGVSQDGNPGYGGSMLTGGSGGRGADEGDNGYSGGGGGGLKSNGRSNKNFGGSKGTGGEGGRGFTAGAVGGRSNQNHIDGGFGGGGGPNGAGGGGGGGGGYSGGASGSRSNSCGGGGGSFNSGSDQLNKPGANTGHGYVSIKIVNFH